MKGMSRTVQTCTYLKKWEGCFSSCLSQLLIPRNKISTEDKRSLASASSIYSDHLNVIFSTRLMQELPFGSAFGPEYTLRSVGNF